MAQARKFYLDTAIWRDYFEDRSDGIRPLGEFAFEVLRRCTEKNIKVIVSEEVINELLTYYSNERVEEVFSSFSDIIVRVGYIKEQLAEARSFWFRTKKRFPFSDIVHSVIARDNKAILISRDLHFSEIGIADCMLPEEAIRLID